MERRYLCRLSQQSPFFSLKQVFNASALSNSMMHEERNFSGKWQRRFEYQ